MHSLLVLIALGMPMPQPAHDLLYTTPATVWDEAFPLGNGVLGALVWGDGAPLKISLDRTDLWDLRPVPEFSSENYKYATMRQWEKDGRTPELLKLYDDPYNRPAPTKIPAGRIELTIDGKPAFQQARLDLAHADALVQFAGGANLQVWIHATEPVGMIRYTGSAPIHPKLLAPAFGGGQSENKAPAIVAGSLNQLGYPPPKESAGPQWMAYEQEGWDGFQFAVYLAWRETKEGWLGAWTVASKNEGADWLAVAKTRVEGVFNADASFRQGHEAWWQQYYEKSSVAVPAPTIERQWFLDTYKFGAASRLNAPPITLQGPWTADDGKLPPWKGDYHHDLNTELSYWPCYSGNRLDEGRNYLDWLWNTRDNCKDWTQRFFGMPGMNVPMTADLKNRQIGGWRQYTHSSTTAAWLAHHFYLQWKYSADPQFLKERAYPYLRDCATFLEAVTAERGPDGLRTLPLSSSPEINDNRPEAWFPSITNYDLALIRWLMGAASEMATALNKTDEAARWKGVADTLPGFALGEDGRLLVARDIPLKESHRHFSHLMAIHPLGLIDVSQGDEARRTIDASLKDFDRLGTKAWCGYSFSWLASIAARAKDGEKAAQALDTFANAFVLRNSFHCNGDQSGKGYSSFTYRPFTLEGNFAFAAGLQEMLLQSHTGTIELFPAIPASWKDCAFTQLRAQGAFLVSAERKAGQVTQCTVTSEKGGLCRILSPKTGKPVERTLKAGETWNLMAPNGV